MAKMEKHRELVFRKLLDYVLLNGTALGRSGLYAGRAGISVCLFEAAKFLQEESLETYAMEYLKQALITRTKDITFENGLAGIGYALDYLIVNGFIGADYDDLFGLQTNAVFDGFCHVTEKEEDTGKAFRYVPVIRLIVRRGTDGHREKARALLDRLWEDVSSRWSDVGKVCTGELPEALMCRFRLLLSATLCVPEYMPDGCHLHLFMERYRLQRLKYDRYVFHYLQCLSGRMEEPSLTGFLCEYYRPFSRWEETDALLDLHDETALLSLEDRSSMLSDSFFKHYMDASLEDIEIRIGNATPDNELKVGLGYGVARLLTTLMMLCSPAEDRQRIRNLLWD